MGLDYISGLNYIIPSDNWEQQLQAAPPDRFHNYIIPSDNWEQQPPSFIMENVTIISYQAITGNNNKYSKGVKGIPIISYQAITGNNN